MATGTQISNALGCGINSERPSAYTGNHDRAVPSTPDILRGEAKGTARRYCTFIETTIAGIPRGREAHGDGGARHTPPRHPRSRGRNTTHPPRVPPPNPRGTRSRPDRPVPERARRGASAPMARSASARTTSIAISDGASRTCRRTGDPVASSSNPAYRTPGASVPSAIVVSSEHARFAILIRGISGREHGPQPRRHSLNVPAVRTVRGDRDIRAGAVMLDTDLKERIRSAVDIVEVIGERIPLRKAGKNFIARCPFHTEKTPSFNVNSERQIYHCFGCGVGGDVFSFLMAYDKVSFPEALRALAERGAHPHRRDEELPPQAGWRSQRRALRSERRRPRILRRASLRPEGSGGARIPR